MGDGQRVVAVDMETSNPCAEIVTGSQVVVTLNGIVIPIAHAQMWQVTSPIFIMNTTLDPLADHWFDMPGDQKAQAFMKCMRGLKLLPKDDVKEVSNLIAGFSVRLNRAIRLRKTTRTEPRIHRPRPKYDRLAICNSSMKGKSYNGR